MCARRIVQSLIVSLLLGAATGCFVGDEIDKASALNNGPGAGGPRAPTAPGAAPTASARPATAKPGTGATAASTAPAAAGTVELIVRRPAEDEREVLDECALDLTEGLVGDAWLGRGSR